MTPKCVVQYFRRWSEALVPPEEFACIMAACFPSLGSFLMTVAIQRRGTRPVSVDMSVSIAESYCCIVIKHTINLLHILSACVANHFDVSIP